MAVLVTGGAGYIGSHTCVELLARGHKVIVADNLVNASEEALRRVEQIAEKPVTFYRVDLRDEAATERVFAENADIDAVIHFAALKAVGESVKKPLEYYSNNLENTLVVLNTMRRHGVRRFVFSSSATVYGEPASVPVTEDFPTSAASPYGATKLFIERILTDLCVADPAFSAALLRYFNPIGAHPSGLIGEDPNGIPNNLVPYIAQVAVGRLDHLNVWGDDYPTPDGTGVRDYIHVMDLARGHVAALDRMEQSGGGLLVCNLGTGIGYSVLEVIAAYSRACGRDIPYVVGPRRPGDVAAVYADPTRAKEQLGWVAEFGIDAMCADSWHWQSMNPRGYQKGPA
ncbi:MAG: UDP-glucose 4-epimerase GalE [Oscillospiraceae bacterium]|jgi:UDP-glucose 4-epimerase